MFATLEEISHEKEMIADHGECFMFYDYDMTKSGKAYICSSIARGIFADMLQNTLLRLTTHNYCGMIKATREGKSEMESKILIEMNKDNSCYNVYGVIGDKVSYTREGITSNDEMKKEYRFLADVRGYKILDRYIIQNGVKTFAGRQTWGSRFDGLVANN